MKIEVSIGRQLADMLGPEYHVHADYRINKMDLLHIYRTLRWDGTRFDARVAYLYENQWVSGDTRMLEYLLAKFPQFSGKLTQWPESIIPGPLPHEVICGD